jgi:hypothetical protein
MDSIVTATARTVETQASSSAKSIEAVLPVDKTVNAKITQISADPTQANSHRVKLEINNTVVQVNVKFSEQPPANGTSVQLQRSQTGQISLQLTSSPSANNPPATTNSVNLLNNLSQPQNTSQPNAATTVSNTNTITLKAPVIINASGESLAKIAQALPKGVTLNASIISQPGNTNIAPATNVATASLTATNTASTANNSQLAATAILNTIQNTAINAAKQTNPITNTAPSAISNTINSQASLNTNVVQQTPLPANQAQATNTAANNTSNTINQPLTANTPLAANINAPLSATTTTAATVATTPLPVQVTTTATQSLTPNANTAVTNTPITNSSAINVPTTNHSVSNTSALTNNLSTSTTSPATVTTTLTTSAPQPLPVAGATATGSTSTVNTQASNQSASPTAALATTASTGQSTVLPSNNQVSATPTNTNNLSIPNQSLASTNITATNTSPTNGGANLQQATTQTATVQPNALSAPVNNTAQPLNNTTNLAANIGTSNNAVAANQTPQTSNTAAKGATTPSLAGAAENRAPQNAQLNTLNQQTMTIKVDVAGQTISLKAPANLPPIQQLQITRSEGAQANIQWQQAAIASSPTISTTNQFNLSDKQLQLVETNLRQALPQQIPIAEGINQLVSQANMIASSPNNTVPIDKVALSIMQLFGVKPGANSSSDTIKRNVQQGGLFTESKLANQGQSQQGDMKNFLAKMSKLAEQLPTEQRDLIQNTTDKMLARVTASQLTHVQQQNQHAKADISNERTFQIDIPVQHNEKLDNVEMEIKQRKQLNDAGEFIAIWSVKLHFDLQERGQVDAEVALNPQDNSISTTFLCSKHSTVAALERRLGSFRQQLHNQGFDIHTIHCTQGSQQAIANNSVNKRIIDIRT